MTKSVYIVVRHAHSEKNLGAGINTSEEDPEKPYHLTPQGHREAMQTGAEIAAMFQRVDSIVSSPLYRARETAAIIINYVGTSTQQAESELLTDIHFGKWDGTTDAKMPKDWRELPEKYGIETDEHMRQRVAGFLESYSEDGVHVVVSHKEWIRGAIAVDEGCSIVDIIRREQLPETDGGIRIPRASITLIDYRRQEGDRVVFIGKTEVPKEFKPMALF